MCVKASQPEVRCAAFRDIQMAQVAGVWDSSQGAAERLDKSPEATLFAPTPGA